MRNISFMLTKDQVRNRHKTVTRRLGWRRLKPGDVLRGVEKAMGLKAGEEGHTALLRSRVLDARRETLEPDDRGS